MNTVRVNLADARDLAMLAARVRREAVQIRDQSHVIRARLTRPGVRIGVPLSPRESEVHRLLARGMTNPAIAAALDIAPGTVKHHVAAVYRKLGVHNRTHVALLAGTPRRTWHPADTAPSGLPRQVH